MVKEVYHFITACPSLILSTAEMAYAGTSRETSPDELTGVEMKHRQVAPPSNAAANSPKRPTGQKGL